MKKKSIFAVKLLVTCTLFYWLVATNKLDFSSFKLISFDLVSLLFIGSIFLHLLIQAFRWKFVARFYQIPITGLQAVLISWVGNFFSLILPGASSGELVRGYYIHKLAPGCTARGISSLFVDRILGFLVFTAFSFCACLYLFMFREGGDTILAILWMSLAVLLCLILLFSMLVSKSFLKKTIIFFPARMKDYLLAKADYGSDGRGHLLWAFLLSICSTFFAICGFLLAGHVLHQPISSFQALIYAPIIIISNTIPISPGGVGVAESVAAVLFLQDGYAGGAEIMLLYRIGISLLRLPGGLVYVFMRQGR